MVFNDIEAQRYTPLQISAARTFGSHVLRPAAVGAASYLYQRARPSLKRAYRAITAGITSIPDPHQNPFVRASRRQRFSRNMPRRLSYRRPIRRRKYGKRRRSRIAPSSRSLANGVAYRERVQRKRVNYKPAFCRSITVVPPRCRDKLVCSAVIRGRCLAATSILTISGNAMRIVAARRPFSLVNSYSNALETNNATSIVDQDYAGWDILSNHFAKYICHGFTIKVTCMGLAEIFTGTSNVHTQTRTVLLPVKGVSPATLGSHTVNQMCDAPASTSITYGQKTWNSNGMPAIQGSRMVAGAATTRAIYGVSASAIQDAQSPGAFNSPTDAAAGSGDKHVIWQVWSASEPWTGTMRADMMYHVEVEGDFEFYEQKLRAADA